MLGVVFVDLLGDTRLLQRGLELSDRLRRDALILAAKHAEHLGLDRAQLGRIGLELAVVDDRTVEIRVRERGLQRPPAAEAPPDHGLPSGVDPRIGSDEVEPRADHRGGLGVIDRLHRGHRLLARRGHGAAVEVDGERRPTGTGEPIRPVLDVAVEAPPLVDHHDRGEWTRTRREAQVGLGTLEIDRLALQIAGAGRRQRMQRLELLLGERPRRGWTRGRRRGARRARREERESDQVGAHAAV